MKPKYHSLIRRTLVIPMLILMPIILLTILMSIWNIQTAQKQMQQQDEAALRVSATQIGSTLQLTEDLLDEYVMGNMNVSAISNHSGSSGQTGFIQAQARVINWITETVRISRDVEGIFLAYPRQELFLLRSTGGGAVAIRDNLHERVFSSDFTPDKNWQLVNAGSGYLVKMKEYQGCRYGMWVSLSGLFNGWMLDTTFTEGSVFLVDRADNVSADTSVYSSGLGITPLSEIAAPGKTDIFLGTNLDGNLTLGLSHPKTTILHGIPLASKIVLAASLLSVLLTPAIVLWLYLRIVKPLRVLDSAMEIIVDGDTEYRIPLRHNSYENEFDRLNSRFNLMLDALKLLEDNLFESRIQHGRTKLEYISRQIRPHFILNALNLVYTYEPEEHAQARKMIMNLSDYFRYIVNLEQDLVTLDKELVHTRKYLDIQRERYPSRFHFAVEWETAVDQCMIPPLIVQTFVENSIKHGFKTKEKIYIYVMAKEEKGKVCLSIGDTGKGMPRPVMEVIQSYLETRQHHKNLGVGIQNAVERMDMVYSQRVDVQIENAEEGGLSIVIRLPMWKEKDNVESAYG